MMKKLFFAAAVLSLTVSLVTPAFCDDEPAAKLDGPITKLGRGLCNMVTFPLEVPEQISRTNESDGPFAASTVGVFKGIGHGLIRACIGLFETATFIIPGPRHYGPIIKDPEYFQDTSNL